MLKQLDAKMEAAIIKAAVRDFIEDFGAMGELAKDTFEIVRQKSGYSINGGTPTSKIYEATRKPLAEVKSLIEAGLYQTDKWADAGLDVCDLAKCYLRRAEVDFADRILEAVNLLRAQEQAEMDAKIETVETRLMACLKSPVWNPYIPEIKYASAGLKMLGFHLAALGTGFQHCHECAADMEGYALTGVESTYIRWRCTNGDCPMSATIQTESRKTTLPEEETTDGVIADIIKEMQERVTQSDADLSFAEHPYDFTVAALNEAAQEILLHRKGFIKTPPGTVKE